MIKNSQSFSLSLKIYGEMVKLLIYLNETKDETFQRLADLYPHCKNKKDQILNRIIETLNYQLDQGRLNQKLKGSIQTYLKNNDAFMTYRQGPKTIIQKIASSNKINRSKPKNLNSSLKNRNQNISLASVQDKSAEISNNKIINKKHSIPWKQKNMSIVTPVKALQKRRMTIFSSQKSKINPDVIKACQIILKKAKNGDMKSMAKEFLKEKGVLKDEKESHLMTKKKLFTASSCQNLQEQLKDQMPLNQQSTSFIKQTTKTHQIPLKKETQQRPDDNSFNQSRLNRYKYLESSLNESLNKDYSRMSYQNNSIDKKSKKYSYLNDN